MARFRAPERTSVSVRKVARQRTERKKRVAGGGGRDERWQVTRFSCSDGALERVAVGIDEVDEEGEDKREEDGCCDNVAKLGFD